MAKGPPDPDDPRHWRVIVPLLVGCLVVAILLATAGAWLMLGIIALATGASAYGQWQAGKPLWPGGPRRRAGGS